MALVGPGWRSRSANVTRIENTDRGACTQILNCAEAGHPPRLLDEGFPVGETHGLSHKPAGHLAVLLGCRVPAVGGAGEVYDLAVARVHGRRRC